MHPKSTFAGELAKCFKERRPSENRAVELLDIDQSKISLITRGLFRGGSQQQMLELVAKLDRDARAPSSRSERNRSPVKTLG